MIFCNFIDDINDFKATYHFEYNLYIPDFVEQCSLTGMVRRGEGPKIKNFRYY